MATEVTTQMRQVVSSSVKQKTDQKPASSSEVRQDLPVSVQSVPTQKEGVDKLSSSQQVNETKLSSNIQLDEAMLGPNQQVDQVKLEQAVDDLNDFIQDVRRELSFSVDNESGRTVIKVIDSESQQVVRQIPPEEVVAMTERLQSRSGLLMQAEV